MKKLVISGKEIWSVVALYDLLQKELGLPDYVRRNPDALLNEIGRLARESLRIEWLDHDESRRVLGEPAREVAEAFRKAEAYYPGRVQFVIRQGIFSIVADGDMDRLIAWLEQGGDPNVSDERGWTLLMEAAAKGNAEIVKRLLEAGADGRRKNHGGVGAVRMADWSCARSLKYGAEKDSYRNVISLLLQHGADINETGTFGTALNLFAKWGRIEMMEFLLQRGADPNVAADDGWTPLHSAVLTG